MGLAADPQAGERGLDGHSGLGPKAGQSRETPRGRPKKRCTERKAPSASRKKRPERKDVLSGLFFLLALGAYLRYASRPSAAQAVSHRGCLRPSAARYPRHGRPLRPGSAAKPMVVTLPFVLLLLDVWPLGRRAGSPAGRAAARPGEAAAPRPLSGGERRSTLLAQRDGLVRSRPCRSAPALANAAVACAAYLGKMLLPRGLAVFYPIPPRSPLWQAAAAAAPARRPDRRSPLQAPGALAAGRLALVPGHAGAGDRPRPGGPPGDGGPLHLPALIGLFLALAWGPPDLARALRPLEPGSSTRRRAEPRSGPATGPRRPSRRASSGRPSCPRIAARAETAHWRDSTSLFRRAAAVTAGNYVAHLNLAEALRQADRAREALAEYRAAIDRPGLPRSRAALGGALRGWGSPGEALPRLDAALARDPADARAHATLAMALDYLGRSDEAIAELRRALARPGLENARPASSSSPGKGRRPPRAPPRERARKRDGTGGGRPRPCGHRVGGRGRGGETPEGGAVSERNIPMRQRLPQIRREASTQAAPPVPFL